VTGDAPEATAAPTPPGPRLAAASVVAATAAALPLVFRALSYTDRILDRDETYWMASALRMRATGLPIYVAGWDTKPPLAFVFHRLALAVAPDAPMLGAHVLGAIVAAAACALVALAARRLAGGAAGLFAALAFALLDSTGTVRALAANTELLTYVPVAAIALAVAAGRPRGAWLAFLVGALSAVAFLAKHPAALFAPAAYAAILLTARDGRPWLRCALAGIGGVAAVLVPTFAWIAASGAWDDFVACNVTMSLHRAGLGAEIADSVGYGRWLAVARSNVPALLGVTFALVRAIAGDRSARRAAGAVGPLAAAGLLAALAGGAAFPHYLLLAYVPLAVLAGVGCAAALAATRFAGNRTAGIAVAVTMLAAAAPARAAQCRQARDWIGYDSGPVVAVRARVQELVPPDGTLFVWGIHPDLYVTCRRAPATRFISCGWLVGSYSGLPLAPEPFEFVPGSWDLLFRDLDLSRPACVVDSVPAGVHNFTSFPVERFPRLDAWLRAAYDREEGPGGYVIWRRR
jgi:4-amino-4-deoxy-L-arabinose transferase-like glycosyltransferase